jgi:hypothetical protein
MRIRPECNEWCFYRIEVQPDLFGRALLVRHWRRIVYTRPTARGNTSPRRRARRLPAAEGSDRAIRTLCMTRRLCADCRLSGALALTAERADLSVRHFGLESLKKRRTGQLDLLSLKTALSDRPSKA